MKQIDIRPQFRRLNKYCDMLNALDEYFNLTSILILGTKPNDTNPIYRFQTRMSFDKKKRGRVTISKNSKMSINACGLFEIPMNTD